MVEYWISGTLNGKTMLDKMLLRKGVSDYSIEKTANGKPYLSGNPMHFNISHSNGMTAVCVSDCEVGIDIQEIKQINPKIAQRFFTENEYEYFLQHGPEGFFTIWTRKESLLKYLGSTLADGISKYDVFSQNIYFFERQIKNCRLCICTQEQTEVVDISDIMSDLCKSEKRD